MIIQIFVILLIIGFYKYVVEPMRRFQWYSKTLQQLGYKVYKQNYRILGAPIFEHITNDKKKYQDPLYTVKNVYPQFDVILSNVFNQTHILLNNPDLLNEFFKVDNLDLYPKSRKLFGGVIAKFISNTGIGFSQGKQWKRKRKILNQVFNFNFIKSQIPTMLKIAEDNFNQLEKSSNYPKVQLYQVFAKIFGQITTQSFLGKQALKQKLQNQTITQFLIKYTQKVGKVVKMPQTILFGPNIIELRYRQIFRQLLNQKNIYLKSFKKFVQKQLQRILKQQLKGQNNQQFLINYIFKHNKNNPQQLYTHQQIIDQFAGLFFGGTDTSSHFLLMIIYYLGIYPQILAKATEQVNKYIKSDADYTYENLKNLKYIDCIEKQTTRIYGPGNSILVRQVTKDHFLKDIPLKKGVLIEIGSRSNGFNPKYFQNPHQFKPQRWEGNLQKQIHPFTILGFSAGPRTCIGKQFALLETKIILAKFLQRYNYQLPKKQIIMQYPLLYSPQLQRLNLSRKQ